MPQLIFRYGFSRTPATSVARQLGRGEQTRLAGADDHDVGGGP
jgi:hypothetical protein